jgi:hypothetical protein
VISGKFVLCLEKCWYVRKFFGPLKWYTDRNFFGDGGGGGRSSKIIFSGIIYNEIHNNQMDKKNCLQKEAGAKKLFATTTTPKKIVCVDEMSIPPLQKNNGPSPIMKPHPIPNPNLLTNHIPSYSMTA